MEKATTEQIRFEREFRDYVNTNPKLGIQIVFNEDKVVQPSKIFEGAEMYAFCINTIGNGIDNNCKRLQIHRKKDGSIFMQVMRDDTSEETIWEEDYLGALELRVSFVQNVNKNLKIKPTSN
jgi:hypothetical protein